MAYILDATTRSLQVKLAGAVTTNQLPIVATWVDVDSSTQGVSTFSSTPTVTNSGTAVTVMAAPASSHTRTLKTLSVQNADTASAVATVIYNDNSTLRNIIVATLSVGDMLNYDDDQGWYVLDSTGSRKSSSGSGSAITALTGDVTATGPGSVAATIAANAVTTSKINTAAVTLAKIANAAANSKWVGSGSGGSGSAYTENSFGAGLSVGASSVALDTANLTRAIGITIDGGGSAITTGVQGFLYVPFACTITASTLLSTDGSVTSGSIVLDLWAVAYASYPPTVSNTITGANYPTLSGATHSQDLTLTSWSTTIAAGTVIAWNVRSASTVTRVSHVLTVVLG